MFKIRSTYFFPIVFLFISNCAIDQKEHVNANNIIDHQKEKTAILKVLNGETAAAFNRDYEGWKSHWVQEKYVTKTYMDYSTDSMSETLGWDDINNFVRTYIEEHPEPDPLPEKLKDIDARIYGGGAWVSYEQNDPGRGLKRETRLMEKIDGQWRIAGMQTVIYGSKNEQ